MKNSVLKEILTLTVKLFVICLVVSGLLAWINSITAPIIAENDAKNFELAMQEMLPEAKDFEELEITDDAKAGEGVTVNSAYKGICDDNICGYVVNTVCHEGYGGDISVMVSITEDGKVNQVKIISMAETAGLGTKAGEDEFLAQYKGLSTNIGVEKNNAGNPDNNTISAISGATRTSKAVTKAVNSAVDTILNGGGINE